MAKLGIHQGSWLQTMLKHGKWYLISSVATKGIIFFLLPIYTRVFAPEEYGALNSLNSIGTLVALALSLYVDSAFGRFVHDVWDKKEDLKRLVSTTISFLVLWGGGIVLLVVLTSGVWSYSLLKLPPWPYVYLAFFPQIFNQIYNVGLIYLRQTLKSKQVMVLQVFNAFIGVGITIVLIFGFGMDIKARLIGNAAAGILCMAIITVVFLKARILVFFKIDFRELSKILKYSIPLIPLAAGSWINTMSDRIVIAKFDSLASTGIYAFYFQLAGLIYMLQDAITQVIGPVSMSGLIHDFQRTVEKINRLSKRLMIFLLLACLGLFLFSKEMVSLILWIGKGRSEYLESTFLISIIALTYVFSAQYRLFSSFISFHKKTWVISSGGVLMAILNLGLNLIFVPRYGRAAAAFTTVFTTAVYALWLSVFAGIFCKFRVKYRVYIFALIGYAAVVFSIKTFLPEILDVSIFFIVMKSLFLATCFLTAYYALLRKNKNEAAHKKLPS